MELLSKHILILASFAFLVGCAAANPESEDSKEFPSPRFDGQTGNTVVLKKAITSLGGYCHPMTTSIQYRLDPKSDWISLDDNSVTCKSDGRFQVSKSVLDAILASSSKKIYARAKGKGTLISKEGWAQFTKDGLDVPPASTQFSYMAAGKTVTNGNYTLKAVVGAPVLGTAASGNYKLRASTSGLLNE